MSRWNDFCAVACRGKTRWLCSAFCTFVLVCAILALPVWNFHVKSEVSEPSGENSIAVVTVTQRKRIKAVEKKSVPKKTAQDSIPTIPPKQQEVEKVEESESEVEEATTDETETEENPVEAADSTDSDSAGEASGAAESNAVLSEPEQKAAESYKSYALSRIASKKTYPYSARSKGIEGKVRVRVTINPDGSLFSSEILAACDSEILNEACLSAIQKAAPFKKMKAGMAKMTFTFVMDFSLK